METIKKYQAQHPLLKPMVLHYIFWRRKSNYTSVQKFLPNAVSGLGMILQGKLLVKSAEKYIETPLYGTRNTLEETSEILTEGDFFNVSIRMHPHGLSCFSGIRMDEIMQPKIFSLDDIFSKNEMAELAEKLYLAKTDEQRVGILEGFLLSRLTSNLPQPIDTIMQFIKTTKGTCTVSELAKLAGITERTVNRLFQKYIGINPVNYINLIRFRCMLDIMNNQASSLKPIQQALDAGYYDQSHFIKEFKKFSSFTPTQFGLNKSLGGVSDFYNT